MSASSFYHNVLNRRFGAAGMTAVCFLLSFNAAAYSSVYDFNSFSPTLDRYYALADDNPDKTSIGSGYSISFDKVEINTNGQPAGEHDFIYQQLNEDNRTIPVYYKVNYVFDGDDTQKRLVNYNELPKIEGYFKDIHQTSYSNPGALYNMSGSKKIGLIAADFINNGVTHATNRNVFGGALVNGGVTSITTGNIERVVGDFIGNYVINQSTGQSGGGALFNIGILGNLTGNFVNNRVEGNIAVGGAILNVNTLGTIEGTFIGNYAKGNTTRGGAIYNTNGNYSSSSGPNVPVEGIPTIPQIKGNFISNYGIGKASAFGGAISNIADAIAPDIQANFIGNYVEADQTARSGAVDAPGGINTITGSFIGNHAESKNSRAYAGAIYVGKNMRFVADGLNNYFTGNYTLDNRGKIYNAIMVDGTEKVTLTFDITGGGNLFFNDNINSFQRPDKTYNVDILGYGTGKFMMNNYIMNADEVTVDKAMLVFNQAPYTDDAGCGEACRGQFIAGFKDDDKTPDHTLDAVTSLTLNNAQFYLYNNYIETVRLKNYTVNGNSLLHIDVARNNGEWVADKISLSGKIEGATQVVVYDKTNVDNRNASVLFIEAPNDTYSDNRRPGVFRVYGSPYKWDIAYNYRGETSGSYWYLVGTDQPNDSEYVGFVPDPITIDDSVNLPEPEPRKVTPEVIAYQGLHAASLEQNRSLAGNIRDKIAADKFSIDPCGGVYDENWDGKQLNNVWVSSIYHNANIDTPVKTDVKIAGLEAGFDLQRNINHKLGIFASYRQGEYELDSSSDNYYSYTGADIDIDSYATGLYYRYDYRHLWVYAMAYGSLQQADIQSKDGVKSDTDGIEIGGSAEAGYVYDINDSIKLEPSIGIAYAQVDFDDIDDDYGKTASYDTIRRTELFAGIRLEKYLPTENGMAKIYVKPSIIQVLSGGDSVVISGLRKVDTYDDATLGRIELGGRYGFSDQLSAYGWTNYTFGSDYDAFSLGVGLNWAF